MWLKITTKLPKKDPFVDEFRGYDAILERIKMRYWDRMSLESLMAGITVKFKIHPHGYEQWEMQEVDGVNTHFD